MSQESDQAKSQAVVRLIGQSAETHAVPADVLIKTLSGMQQLVYLIASDAENKKVGQRFRVTEDIHRRYALVCELPKAGSYAVPVSIEPQAAQLQITGDGFLDVFGKAEQFLQSISDGNAELMRKCFSDQTFVKRALIEARKFVPNSDDSWKFGFSRAGKEVLLSKESVKRIDDWLVHESPAESVITITGELIRIDFDERKVVLRYPPTRQVIECIYSDELEDIMIENRREYIQVTGEFTLDANNQPIKLTEVSRISPLDLSPVILSEVQYGERKFQFKKASAFLPELDKESGYQLLEVDAPSLGIHAFAATREELMSEISEQIAFLWDSYALEESDALTPEAQQLKATLLMALVELK